LALAPTGFESYIIFLFMKTISNTMFGGFCEKGAVAAVGLVFDVE
jgi:hypothetical protein